MRSRSADHQTIRLLVACCLVAFSCSHARAQAPAAPTPKPAAYVEDSPAAQDLLEQARQTLKQDRPADAVPMYQQLLEGFPGKLIESGDRAYADVSRVAAREIRGDRALLAAYRTAMNPVAQRALASARGAADLETVASRYGLTDAGLEASLRLAAIRLESADLLDASSILDALEDHPDLAPQLRRWRQLQATTAMLAGANDRSRTFLLAMKDAGDNESLDTMRTLNASQPDASLTRLWNSARRPSLAQFPEKLGQPLWKMEMWEVPTNEAQRKALQQMKAANAQVQPFLTPVPASEGDSIFINNGAMVFAIDRNSGRVAWFSQAAETDLEAGMRPWIRMTARLPDARGVGVGADIVASVVGYASPGMGPWQAQATATSLVAMRRGDGKTLWNISPRALDPALANAFFHGTPIVAQGRVLALMRRSQMSGFQDAYVAAVDATTGRTLWRRYLSSAVNVNQGFGRPMAQMTLDGSSLYIADQLNSVSCVDVRTGSVKWLRLIGDGGPAGGAVFLGGRRQEQLRIPPAAPPVLCEAGLIVPALGQARGFLLLDTASGAKVRDLDEGAWVSASYALPFDGDVLLIGGTTARMTGKTPALAPKWELEIPGGQETAPRGMATVTADRIAIPLQDRIVTLNASTGKITFDVKAENPINILALDGQLVVVDADSIRSYMEWDRVRATLAEASAKNPSDPNPPLTIAQLALWLDKKDELLAGVEKAVAAVELRSRSEPADPQAPSNAAVRSDAFRRILALAEWPRELDPAIRATLFDRAHRMMSGPSEEVAYHLAIGSFLGQSNQHEEAADHYQAVIGDPSLATRLYEQGGSARQAGLEARLRLADLIRSAGPRVYARHEADAARRLSELTSMPAPDPEALLELARRYPLSTLVPSMLFSAAEAQAARGDTQPALANLRRAYSQAGDAKDILPSIVGGLAELYTKNNQPRVAMQWLERAKREHSDLKPLREGKPVAAEAWIAELAKLPTGDLPLPSLRTPLSQPVVLPGRLLMPMAQNEDQWPRDRFVTLRGDKLDLRTGKDLVPTWTATVPAKGIDLLWMNRQSVALYDGSEGRLIVLDAASGKTRWEPIDIRRLLDNAGADQDKQAAKSLEERQFMARLNPQGLNVRNGRVVAARQAVPPNENTLFIRANETAVLLADRTGRVVCVEQASGRTLWRMLCPFERLDALDLDGDTVALAGTINSEIDVPNSALLLIDPATGEPRTAMLEDKNTFQWMSLGGDGLVICVTSAEVIARHAIDGSIAWRTTAGGLTFTGTANAGSDLVIVQDKSGVLVALDTQTGRVAERLTLPTTDAQLPVSLRCVEGQWQVMSRSSATALGADGSRRWTDAIDTKDKYLWRQLVGEKHVLLINVVAGPAVQWHKPSSGAGFAPPQVPGQPAAGGAQLNQQDLQDAMRIAAIRGEARIQRGGVQIVVKMPDAGPNVQERQVVEIRQENQIDFFGGPPDWPAGKAPESRYRLFLLDRRTGALVDQRDLGPIRDPLVPAAVFLDNAVVLTTGNATLVIRGTSAK